MLKDMYWVSYAENIRIELQQSKQEGKDVSAFTERAGQIRGFSDDFAECEAEALKLYGEIEQQPVSGDFPYYEPSDLEGIQKASAQGAGEFASGTRPERGDRFDRVYGAWLGRCCGCLLGQPVENWMRDEITGLLKDTGNYPIHYYISSDIPEEIRQKYNVRDDIKIYGSNVTSWINNISYMPEDDDTNYTLIALKIMEERGFDFTPEDVAMIWLDSLPYGHVCTAERTAYRNFVNVIAPPLSATYHNPYREWIGAQIRADLFGYIVPGNPRYAAELAWRDASISHTKNGIYGAMFIAGMLSQAAVSDDLEDIIEAGLAQVPKQSRLHEKIRRTMAERAKYPGWEEAIQGIHEEYNEENIHDWCHTIPNAAIVVISLLYGEMSLEKSIGIAVSAGLDTDCNGATVGSIIGMIRGAKGLPQKWVEPLNDQIKSGVDGLGLAKISDIARRTVRQIDIYDSRKEKTS